MKFKPSQTNRIFRDARFKGKNTGRNDTVQKETAPEGRGEGSALVTVPQGGGRVPDGVLLNLVVVRVFALQVFTELLSLHVVLETEPRILPMLGKYSRLETREGHISNPHVFL